MGFLGKMKIHVIPDRIDSDRILPRLARYLSVYNGWSLSEEPDLSADFNYFNNYGTYHRKCHGWHGTPIGAYFSHVDPENQAKEQQWHDVAELMDVCVTTAKMYNQFLPDSKVYQARPPVEAEQFTIAPQPKTKKPVVGVSGFVYGDGRKGEHLWQKLTAHPLAGRLNLRASGRASGKSWPNIRTKYYQWSDLHQFIQSLNVLLVPSLFEGIPMPPLEALACGVKIVIPRGVGLLDELPEADGIYRYECGNARAMIEAVEQAAFSGKVDRQALRQIILDDYTIQHWADDHKRIVADYFQHEDVENLPAWQGSAGVYMVAFGAPSRKCAERAIDSVHRFMPGLPVALVSNEPLGTEDIFIQHNDADAGGRIAKLKCDELAPRGWTYVLYIDADIEIVGDIGFLFQVLQDGWEFVICKDNNKYGTVREMKRPDNLDECQETWDKMGDMELLQYNGGMMAYRRNRHTRRFFEKWQSEWQKYGKRDQGALLRALYDRPLRVFVLMNQWNATTRYELPPGEIAIKHHNMEARRWNGIIQGRIDSPEAWQAVKKYRARLRE
jgi:glycosyltransferase involved in cell wall biosynthesis